MEQRAISSDRVRDVLGNQLLEIIRLQGELADALEKIATLERVMHEPRRIPPFQGEGNGVGPSF